MANPVSPPIKTKQPPDSSKSYTRFDLSQRIEHFVLVVSFTLLGLTGIPQKFSSFPVSVAIIRFFGGIELTRQVHHISAIALGAISIYHVLSLLYRVFVLRVSWSMIPLVEDFRHLFQDIGYYLGLREHKAYYGRYNYAEKAEYMFVVWGTLIMGITGFMLWNPIATSRWLPGEIIPASKAAHGGEAVLAILAIILWHVYNVHIRQFNKSMFTGKLTRKEMEHEHPAELAQIESGQNPTTILESVLRRRQKIYFPAAIILTAALGYGFISFVTFEETAIATVPRGETVPVYVPITPTPIPTPTPTPILVPGEGTGADTWRLNYESLFRNRCGGCHGVTAVGGITLATYQDALKGGNSGPGIVPGDPDASVVVQIQSIGSHPGQLTVDELAKVIDWIIAGAPEQ